MVLLLKIFRLVINPNTVLSPKFCTSIFKKKYDRSDPKNRRGSSQAKILISLLKKIYTSSTNNDVATMFRTNVGLKFMIATKFLLF